MSPWTGDAALAVAAAGILCFILATLVRGQPRAGLGMMLDLWVAAGLLRLGVSRGWEPIASAAALTLCRKLVIWSLAKKRDRPSLKPAAASA